MMDVDIMKDGSEVVYYDRPEIPLYVRTACLSEYPNMRALAHWHEDIELIYILKGKMNYDINGKKILLEEKDSLMVNAKQMHFGSSCERQECEFLCILFHPVLFSGCQQIFLDYLFPVTENQGLEYLHFHAGTGEGQEIAGLFQKIAGIRERHKDGHEKDSHERAGHKLEIIGILYLLWSRIYDRAKTMDRRSGLPEECPDISLQKIMVSYIHQHYGEKITLDHIAASGNVCRSKCCAVFKHYLGQSPVDFLNTYRLKVSGNLLESTDMSITEIALSCGFHHLSYFSKQFLRYYGCTPSEYRDTH